MSKQFINWVLFIGLSFVWGSSFILMKLGIRSLTFVQVASIRILSAGILLLPLTIKHLKNIPLQKIKFVFASGVLGSLIPAYLFCLAETRIDSALAGALNSLTPIFAILAGTFLFKQKIDGKKIYGIMIAFAGSIFLLFSQGIKGNNDMFYMNLIILATISYGLNINIVHKYLHSIGSLKIASVALSLCAIPAFIILLFTHYFTLPLSQKNIMNATFASSVLGIGGTAIATILFYVLVKRAGVIFASMVTYGIPFIAFFWGVVAGEIISWKEVTSLVLILSGIYLANKPAKVVVTPE